MCRSIKTLRRSDEPATDDEIHAAALQFVRKVSGYRAPSRANQGAFDDAVAEIAGASRRLLEGLAPAGTRSVSAAGLVPGSGTGSVSRSASGSVSRPASGPPRR